MPRSDFIALKMRQPLGTPSLDPTQSTQPRSHKTSHALPFTVFAFAIVATFPPDAMLKCGCNVFTHFWVFFAQEVYNLMFTVGNAVGNAIEGLA